MRGEEIRRAFVVLSSLTKQAYIAKLEPIIRATTTSRFLEIISVNSLNKIA